MSSASRRPAGTLPTLVLTAAAASLLFLGALPGIAQARTVWLCKPGKEPDPCRVGLMTTRFSASGQRLGVENVRAGARKVDCFYVYPTVSDQQTQNANLHIDPEERSIALYQAARYSQECRVFAPMYRQVTLRALFSGQPITNEVRRTAFSSAAEAWQTYLRRYNDGRGVVLIGHSQGTFVLRQLIAQRIDPHPKLRRKLVSALLLGGNVTVQKGRGAGGDFQHIRACRSRAQLHCVVAFSTFNAPVPQDAVFGRTAEAGLRVLCTNPAALGGGASKLTTIFPSKPFAPGTTIGIGTQAVGFPQLDAKTPWIQAKAYTGECSSANDANVLQITGLPGAPNLNPVPSAAWGLHLTDANIALGDLSSLVRHQASHYVRQRARRDR